jgi:glucokinase
MQSLHAHLSDLARDPRAQPWTARMHAGWSGNAPVRAYTLFAPPNAQGAKAILARLHNAMLLLNPAAAQLSVPVATDRLEPWLGQYRSVHRIGIFLDGEPVRPPTGGGYDLPSMHAATVRPPGEGLAAGLDIGGTGMKACVLRADGTLVRTASAPTWPDGERGIGSLVTRARALLQTVADGEPLGSLGIGLASPMGVGGRILELSTVMRARVGDLPAFEGFSDAVAAGLVQGPVAMFNDLANLGRHLSAQGERRIVRFQIGTSFGGCWIDSNGTVYGTEMGRLVIDGGPDAVPHPYLPLPGAARAYLSNKGLAEDLSGRMGAAVDPRVAGHALREALEAGDPRGVAALDRMGAALRAAVAEVHAILPGVRQVQVGGSMLAGPTGAGLLARVAGSPVEVVVSSQPGHDGAIAAARAPRVDALLKGMRRVG